MKQMSMTYSEHFKEEALKLSDEIGLRKAAQQLGLPYYTLSNWRCKRNIERKSGNSIDAHKEPETPELKRIRELETENMELKQANEILKDALGFFAKDRKK